MKRQLLLALGGAAMAAGVWAAPGRAEACGCFAPASVGEPVVQAGERIVFAQEDGEVTAHIQIQYQGEASEFAWLVPLPAQPDVSLGAEELFAFLDDNTAPRFILDQVAGESCRRSSPTFACGGFDEAAGIGRPPAPDPDPVAVEVSSAGPYDFAVLRADEKAPLLAWLQEHRYYVPSVSDEALAPYIRPGAFFLALKLRAGQTTGDLQPIVIRYSSDAPMIPLILTSIGATPNMGVQVWVLGSARAVPVNYQHVLINEEHIDWRNGAANYAEVVTRAVDEASGGHAFVTEHSGPTRPMAGLLDFAGRFSNRSVLERTWAPGAYVRELRAGGFWWPGLQGTLRRVFPMPESARSRGITEEAFYDQLDRSVETWPPESFDPVATTAEIWERVVEPTLAAGALFRRHAQITRFFTTLSPEEMTKDPVFAFNPSLPDVPRERVATLVNECEGDVRASLILPDGRRYDYPSVAAVAPKNGDRVPAAARVEILRLEGPPEVVVNNAALLADHDDLNEGGCRSTGPGARGAFDLALLFAVVLGGRALWTRRRR